MTRSPPWAASCRANSAPSPELAPVMSADLAMRDSLGRAGECEEPISDAGARGVPARHRVRCHRPPARPVGSVRVARDLQVQLGDLEEIRSPDDLAEELAASDDPDALR